MGAPFPVKRNIKVVHTQCQAHSKYLVKISYNDYPKFMFRCVVLDKYPVGNGIYRSCEKFRRRFNVITCTGIWHSALNTISLVNVSPLPLSLQSRKHNTLFVVISSGVFLNIIPEGRTEPGSASEGRRLGGTQKRFLIISLSVNMYSLTPETGSKPSPLATTSRLISLSEPHNCSLR